jgi:hypothetical protein
MDRRQAEDLLAKMSKEVARLTIVAPTDATVTLDGAPVEDWREPVEVTPGSHVLVGHLGAQVKSETVSAGAGDTTTVDVTPAKTEVTAVPAPTAAPALRAQLVDEVPPAAPSSRPSQVPRIAVTVAVGAAAVAAGIVGAVLLQTGSNDTNKARAGIAGCLGGSALSCSQGHSLAQDGADNNNLATGFFIGAGVLAGAAVAAWFVLAPGPGASSGAWVTPAVSRDSAGLVFGGRF